MSVARPRKGRVLAFDFGLRRIGVAVGNLQMGSSSALVTLPAREGIPDWDGIRRLIDEWRPCLLLVGLPTNMDGSEGEISEPARRFARRLQGRYGIDYELVDERLSSLQAEERLREQGVDPNIEREAVDRMAAQIIMETWLAESG